MDYSDDKDVLEIFECEQALRNSCVPTMSCFRYERDDIAIPASSDPSWTSCGAQLQILSYSPYSPRALRLDQDCESNQVALGFDHFLVHSSGF